MDIACLEQLTRMDTLEIGLTSEVEWSVTDDLCTVRGGYHVFSTPSMVLLVERTAIRLLEPHLEAGQSSVGTRVDIRHMAPTLAGMKVRAETELVHMDRRKVSFKIRVFDDAELVGEADHERFVIDVDKYVEKLKKKLGR